MKNIKIYRIFFFFWFKLYIFGPKFSNQSGSGGKQRRQHKYKHANKLSESAQRADSFKIVMKRRYKTDTEMVTADIRLNQQKGLGADSVSINVRYQLHHCTIAVQPMEYGTSKRTCKHTLNRQKMS